MRGGAGLAEKTTKSKTAAAEKLVVLSVVPEWASPTAIAKLVGVSARRIQQLTQDGELSTESCLAAEPENIVLAKLSSGILKCESAKLAKKAVTAKLLSLHCANWRLRWL